MTDHVATTRSFYVKLADADAPGANRVVLRISPVLQ